MVRIGLQCVGAASVVLSLLAACANPPSPESTPVSERAGLIRGEQGLGLGSDCTRYEGNTGCASGLCLRILPGLPPTGVCSRRCDPGRRDDCAFPGAARNFECKQLWPSDQGWMCVPLLSRAELRGAGVLGSEGLSDGGANP